MSDDLLRVGIIGIGLYATLAHVPQLRATGKVEVVAISRRNAERLAHSQQQLGIAAAYTDWRELLDHPNLDAVVISTPHHVHAEQGLAALERGLHVLMEKPLALAAHDAWQLAAAAEKVQRTLLVGYNRRFLGLWRTIKQLLMEGGIGPVRQISLQLALYRKMYWQSKRVPEMSEMLLGATGWPVHYFEEWEAGQDWHANAQESGGGMFSNSGAHFVDLLLWLAGSHPVEVVAFSEAAGMPAESFLSIQSRLANGTLISIASADTEPGGMAGQGTMAIIGEMGIINWDVAKPQEAWLLKEGRREQIVSAFADSNAAAAFVSVILEGTENLAPPREGAYAVAFSEAVYRSAAEKRIVTIEYPSWLEVDHLARAG